MSAIQIDSSTGVGNAVTPTNLKATLKTAPEKYVSIGDLIDVTKPDNRDLLVNTYGDQGITGFLQLTGATRSGGTADEVQYWEEGRLHKTVTASLAAGGATGQGTLTTTDALRANDVLLTQAGDRLVVINPTTAVANVKTLDGTAVTEIAAGSEQEMAIIGNVYAQGTGQPSEFYQTEVIKRVLTRTSLPRSPSA